MVATARMLGKAEMICEIDADADPSVRIEFQRRLQQAQRDLEAAIMERGESAHFTLPPSIAPAVNRPTRPQEPQAAAKKSASYNDWDEDRQRFGSIPAVMALLVALGLFAHWAYGGSFGASDTFQYYVARERCLAVSDAILDLRNGRPQRLPGDLPSLQREEAGCASRNMYATTWK
ncbi:hypothetical protein LA66_11570 [Aureimonas altamirensis]|uniref:Uncharacterized protein n=1 Tax=Aureimonas altamirensis TaxID=370622 RepID=A0A0B1Q005_9HYPH|nr:hypothetical protein LA66_11570 [Aureimonas altamirensis]